MKVVITGGAGFVGCNLAADFLARDNHVLVVDNFSRVGTEKNAQWLSTLPGRLEILHCDVRNYAEVKQAVQGADAVFHLAAQVAVTTSVLDPRTDFEINALGTFNVLEAVRNETPEAFVACSSTNKVYGSLEDIATRMNGSRYSYADLPEGIDEIRCLDFHSPYGCSKGAGEQYVRDYSRIYGLKTVVFRQACIYGPHQFGNEDQGWLAHFMIRALQGRKITIYGDGFQVRDVLHVDDLVSCFNAAQKQAKAVAGEIFNIGGGPTNTLSLLELIDYLERSLVRPVEYDFADWRPGDQRIYVSDIRKAANTLGWEPSVGVGTGLDRLMGWLKGHLDEMP